MTDGDSQIAAKDMDGGTKSRTHITERLSNVSSEDIAMRSAGEMAILLLKES